MRRTESTFPTTDGLTLFGRAWLPDSAPRATLVLVHGYAEHSGRYEHAGACLADRGYAVYALDLRGHGRSEGDRVFVRSFNEYLDDVDAWLARVGEDAGFAPAFILGHSMGAAVVALSSVTRRPAVDGMILSGGVLLPASGIQRIFLEAIMLLARVAPRLKLSGLDSALVSRDPEVVALYDSDPLNYRGKIPAATIAAMTRAVRVIRDRTPSISMPLLVLHGSADQLTNPEGSRRLYDRAASPDKMFKLYEGLYHEIMNEPEKDLVLADIAAWLDRHTTASRVSIEPADAAG